MTEPYAEGADYAEFKEVESENSLREFVAGVDGSHLTGFHNRVGPAYLAVIKPFHHLVIRGMLKAGAARPA